MAGEKKTLKTRLIQVGSQKFDAPYSLADLIITTDGKTVKEILDEFDVEIGNPKDVDNNIDATGLYKLIEDKTIDTSTLQLKEDNSLITTDKTVVGAIAEIINEYLGSKKLVYLTQAEYDALSDTDKNDDSIVYCITDAEKIENIKPATTTELGGVIVGDTLNVNIDGLLDTKLTYNEITVTDVTIPDSGMSLGYLTSPNGNKFKLVVDDSGNLSTEQIIEYGNIVLSTNTLTIEEGKSSTFKVKLDKAPTNNEVINITTDNTDVAVNPTLLTFTKDNYNTEHVVTINVVEDNDTDNDSCVITLSNDNVDNKTINITITDVTIIDKSCTSILLDKTSLTLTDTNPIVLTATPTPTDTTDSIIWSVNPDGIVTVNNGTITAIKDGTATVTVTCGTQTATCDVSVSGVSSTDNKITPPTYGVVMTIKSNSDTSQATPILNNGAKDFEVYKSDGTYIDTVYSSKSYIFDEADTEYKIKIEYSESDTVLNYEFNSIEYITKFDYIGLPPNFIGSTRYIHSLTNLTEIDEINLNNGTVIPPISDCPKLTSINKFSNIDNLVKLQGMNANSNLRFVLDDSKWWNRVNDFTEYKDVFAYTKMKEVNPTMPKSWGGSNSILLINASFKSNAPTDNPNNAFYQNYIENIQPRYADFGTFSVESPSNLVAINNSSTGQLIYTTEWDNFSGTETCVLKYSNSEGTVICSLNITLTK